MDGQQQYADAMRAFDAYYATRLSVYGLAWPAKHYAEHRLWKTFMKIAAFCSDKNRDVERYVTTVIEHINKNADTVVPGDLLTKKAEQLWLQHQGDKKTDAVDKWACYVRGVTQIQLSTDCSDVTILSSPFNSQFPAWFRVFYPETLDNTIVASWGEEALENLRSDRELVRFLRAVMPGKMEEFEKKMGVIDGL